MRNIYCWVIPGLICISPHLSGQKIIASKKHVLMDEVFSVSVKGIAPHQSFIVHSSMADSSGRSWRSFAAYKADEKGEADLGKISPENGTYSGVNPMGLIQSMNLEGVNNSRLRYLYDLKKTIPVTFELEVDEKIVSSIIIERSFIKQDIVTKKLQEQGMIGTLYYPSKKKMIAPVIVLGGSEGGLSGEDVAVSLANHGYAALALAYFNIDDLPADLKEIPLEYFKKAIDWLLALDFVKRAGVAIVGTSKGAEAGLLVSALYKEVKGIVAYVPSNVTWSCICNNATSSSWSYEGRSVPFVKQASDPDYKPAQGTALTPAVNYTYRLGLTNNFNEVLIQVEKINGPVLVISGKKDQLWPSDFMAKGIMDRLKRFKHSYNYQHLSYNNAGHLIGKLFLPSGTTLIAGGRIETGGTNEGNALAQQDSWPKVLNFLQNVFKRE